MKKRRVGFPALERLLRPGVVIRVYVTDPDKIGKFTSFKLRDGKAPRRSDSCLKGEP